MSNYDMSIHQSADAMEWAKFFCKQNPGCGLDEGVMEGNYILDNRLQSALYHLIRTQSGFLQGVNKMIRDFTKELENARLNEDWASHERIWDERRCAEVDAEESRLAALADLDGSKIFVLQDGADFYVHSDRECEHLVRTETAPFKVTDFDMAAATKARVWFHDYAYFTGAQTAVFV